MLSHAPCLSPLMHQDIYLEDAVFAAVQSFQQRYGTCVEVTRTAKGWHITAIEGGTFLGDPGRLLRELMNEVLVRSLEERLEQLTP
jgi:hypothetical protein